MPELVPIRLDFGVAEVKQQSQEIKALLKSQSDEHDKLLQQQLKAEKEYGANVGALRVHYLKVFKDLDIKHAQEISDLKKEIAEKTEDYLIELRKRSIALGNKQDEKDGKLFETLEKQKIFQKEKTEKYLLGVHTRSIELANAADENANKIRAQRSLSFDKQVADWKAQFNREQNLRLFNDDKNSQQKRARELAALKDAIITRSQTPDKSQQEATLKAIDERVNKARIGGLETVREAIFTLEEQIRRDRAKSAVARIANDEQEIKSLQKKIGVENAELQLLRSAEKSKIGRTFSEQLEKGAFGEVKSGFREAAAVLGITVGAGEIIKIGQESLKLENALQGAYRTAGATAKQASLLAKQASADYEELGIKIGLTDNEYKALSQTAAFSGGFLGEMNKQLVIAAGAIEKQTKQSAAPVSGEMFIKAVSLGVNSEEGSNTIGQLRRSMPLLAEELSKATSKEDLFRIAIDFANESVKNQIKYMDSADAALERETLRREAQIERLGRSAVNIVGLVLKTAEKVDEGLDIVFGTMSKEEEDKYGKVISTLSSGIGWIGKTIFPIIPIVNSLTGKTEELTEAQKAEAAAAKSANAVLQQTSKEATDAAAELGVLTNAYINVKNVLDSFDTKRLKVEYLKDEATILQQKIDKGELYSFGGRGGIISNKSLLEKDVKGIKELGSEIGKFNTIREGFNKKDPSQTQENTSGLSKSAFDKSKAILEDAMKARQTLAELDGIQQKKTKEQIEIDLLNIQIKYDLLIAERAKKGSQLQAEYTLNAAKAQARIVEINRASQAEYVKTYYDNEEKHLKLHEEFILATTKDSYEKQHLELYRKLQKDLEDTELSNEEILRRLDLYYDAYEAIETDKNDKLITKRTDVEKKSFEIQKRGIEERIKHVKDSIPQQVDLEEQLYKSIDTIRENDYQKQLRDAKGDAITIANVEKENNLVLEINRVDHLQRLKTINEDANKDIIDVYKNTGTNVLDNLQSTLFRPLEEEFGKTKNIALGAALDIGKGFIKLLSNKAITSLGNSLLSAFSSGTTSSMYPSAIGPELPKDISSDITNATIPIQNATLIVSSLDTGSLQKVLINEGDTSDFDKYSKSLDWVIQSLKGNPGGISTLNNLTQSELKRGDSTGTHFTQPDERGSIKMSPREVARIQQTAQQEKEKQRAKNLKDAPPELTVEDVRQQVKNQMIPQIPNISEMRKDLTENAEQIKEYWHAFEHSGVGQAFEIIRHTTHELKHGEGLLKGVVGGVGGIASVDFMKEENMLKPNEVQERNKQIAEAKDQYEKEQADLGRERRSKDFEATKTIPSESTATVKPDLGIIDPKKTGQVMSASFIEGVMKSMKGSKTADIGESLLSTGLSTALSFLPGGGIIGSLLPLLGLEHGGVVPQYFAKGTGLVKFQSKGTDTVPAMLSPNEAVLTPQQNKDLRLFASNSGFSGGSSNNDAMVNKLIQSNHAIGNAIDNIQWKLSGADLRASSNMSYSNTINKKMA